MADVSSAVPSKPTNVTAVRNSDTKNTVSWSHIGKGMDQSDPSCGFIVARMTDGGQWSDIAKLSGALTRSYVDGTTSANHFYKYRVKAFNLWGASDAVESSNTVYNTPAAPTEIFATRTYGDSVAVHITNPAITATGIEVERSTDRSTWANITTVDGSAVNYIVDFPGDGIFYYRARNTRGELISDWSPTSNAVVNQCPPSQPTLVSPASGSIVSKTQQEVTLSWIHNPIDGSEQTGADIMINIDDDYDIYRREVVGSASSLSIQTPDLNSTVSWRVRTKGVSDEFGDWSESRVFYVRQNPSVAFSNPVSGFVISNTPVHVSLQYSDPSGRLENATLTISKNGRAVYTRDMGTSLECDILASEWLPDNGAKYTFDVMVRSTSTLTATASRDVSVSFTLPQKATADVTNDPETGVAGLYVKVDQGSSNVAATSVAIWREVGDKRVFLGDGFKDGSSFTDWYAPLNVHYRYIVTSFADSGAANQAVVENVLETQWFFFLWGERLARGRVNPEGSRRLTRPNRRRRHFAGRQAPVSFDDGSVDDKRSVSLLLRSKAEADEFEDLMWGDGRCVYKSGDGDVIHADVEMSDKQAWMQPTYHGAVTLTVTRIDGKEL